MYGKEFCKVYNEFGWNYYPEAFGAQLKEWLPLNNFNPKTMLDIGCGTGILCSIMEEMGLDTIGIDLSKEMIRVAKDNYPSLKFEAANMITYKPDCNMDLVTCTGDALNHLLCLDDVNKVLENVYSYLTPGGSFIFDILNGQEGHEDEPFELDYSDTVKCIFRITKESGNRITLRTAIYENNEFSFEEQIVEQYYNPQDLIDSMTRIGYINITCSDQLLPGEPGHGTTWFITGRKPE